MENLDKIALVTDSSCDLPKEILDKYDISVIPLRIIYSHGEYRDRVDIQPEEIYQNFKKEIPTTSMPSMEDVINTFTTLKEKGFKKILSIHLSKGLSGTYNMVNLVSKDFPDIHIEVIDSNALSMGLGFAIIEAANMIKEKMHFEDIKKSLGKLSEKIKVYYSVPVLDYLRKGGRIGLVAATVGSILDLKPIISINKEGKYFTYTKVRGRNKALSKLVEIVEETCKSHKINLAVMHGAAHDEAMRLKELFSSFPNVKEVFFGQISPALVVHTGPGLVGVTIQEID
jgi:DegV family protein with EDD domain